MSTAWDEQKQRWQRYEAWENEQLRARPADYAREMAWLAEAWEIARRSDPDWGSWERTELHCRHLVGIRRQLARARLSP